LGWDAQAALADMGTRAVVCDTVEALAQQVAAQSLPGDHIVCMSNGGFGGIHARLIALLGAGPAA
jgi:UDP-N-acetylmuramate: L-alanyl-gamma-D-glutamyl-meso-diaminopimelate ligase